VNLEVLVLDYNKLADGDVFISLATAPQLRVMVVDIEGLIRKINK